MRGMEPCYVVPSSHGLLQAQAPPRGFNRSAHQALLKEVTDAVCAQTDARTSACFGQAWSRGAGMVQKVCQAKTDNMARLEAEIGQQVASIRSLEGQTRLLQESLQRVLHNIDVLALKAASSLGAPPNAPPRTAEHPRTTPLRPPALPIVWEAGPEEDAELAKDPSPSVLPPPHRLQARRPVDDTTLASAAAVARLQESSSQASTAPPYETFSLTLRRVGQVPFGLELTSDGQGLVVEAVHCGSVCEAWNRQNIGELREIRTGDRIVSVNGVQEAEAMRSELHQKVLIKMQVERGEPADSSSLGSAGSRTPEEEA